jgi:anaerobic selenocysteine-containing dehydrogenase
MPLYGLTGKIIDEKPRRVACWFCYQNCGVLVHIKDGKVNQIVGDPDHPVNHGARCPRNYAWEEYLDHPDRVNYPLKREGKRGSGKWKRVTWEEALADIASKLQIIKNTYGAEAVASSGGTNRTDDWARRRFFNLFGSPNIFHTDPICGMNSFMIESAIYGWGAETSPLGSKLIVIWGHNAAVSYLPLMNKILDARENGAELMVIDPRYTETTREADIWLQIRPGTDGALALSWINTIIEEGLYDRHFVQNYTHGFEELREHVRKFTPEWAEKVTSIAKNKIRESAIKYATSKPACITWGVALDHIGRSAAGAIQSRAILRAITGNLDITGGNPLQGPHQEFVTDWELELNEMLPEEQRSKQLGSDRFKLMSWPGYAMLSEQAIRYWGKAMTAERTCQAHAPTVWRAIITGKPYPVKALLVVASNPLLSYANSRVVHEALTAPSLELLVVMDFWLTPTAELADYVLPPAFWLERPVITSSFGMSNFFIANEKGIEPLYERRTDFQFWRDLGLLLEQSEYWPWQTLDEAYAYRIGPTGYTDYEKFVHEKRLHVSPTSDKKYVHRGFATPTGKVELFSTILERLGYNPLPHYEEPAESPVSSPILARNYPLILISGNFMPYHHSELRQIRSMREIAPDPKVEVNPETASDLGLADGDEVYIETKRGRVKMNVSLNPGILRKVVFAQKGWWFPEREGAEPHLHGLWESNINVCTDDEPDRCDPLCGSWNNRAVQCKVYKA